MNSGSVGEKFPITWAKAKLLSTTTDILKNHPTDNFWRTKNSIIQNKKEKKRFNMWKNNNHFD